MKKWIAVTMCIAVLCSVLAGCAGNKDAAFKTEDTNTVPEDSYEINWFMIGDAQSDVSSVEEAVNAYLKDKINATVKMNCLPSAQYKQKVGTMINANEYFDLCFCIGLDAGIHEQCQSRRFCRSYRLYGYLFEGCRRGH